MNIRKRPTTPVGRRTWAVGAVLALSIGILVPAAGSAVLGSARSSASAAKSLRAQTDQNATLGVWSAEPGGNATDVTPKKFRSYRLDEDAIAAILARAPHERTAAAANAPLVLSLPGPGGFPQRFAIQESPVMQAELARAHPEIATYSGRGIDDLAATIRADISPLGFHASIRSPKGNWYIDPSSDTDEDAYIVYYSRDLPEDPDGPFEFKESDDEEIAAAAAELSTNGGGPTVGSVLRTYRLALVTDQSYATYFGAANVTAAKAALLTRVNQIYEDETSIRLVLINDTDKTNLNTDADAILPNGPCGSAACFTAAQLASCSNLARIRIVLGQLVGASNYDIGHLGLGKAGGGVANLAVVGGNSKAQGCTGLPNPEGDFYAVDYVAHEMGHQFAGNHTFNGTQLNCSGGNRNASTSVEPGSGSSIMAYAGICRQDDLQPHSDPYWSQRSFEEITNYVTSSRPPINEVQTASLRDFDGTDSFKLRLGGGTTTTITNGVNYTAAGIQVALQGVAEIQTVALSGYDGTDSYTLNYKGTDSVPITRGANNTAAGIQNALQGGNEQQQAVLTGFSATTQTFQIEANGNTSALFGLGGLAVSNANVAAQVNSLLGSTGVTSSGAGNGGFTLTFGGSLAGTDVAAISIVSCSGACVATVRENAKGGGPIAGWPASGTVAVTGLTDAGYTLTFGGSHQGTDVDPLAVTNGSGVTGTVTETVKGTPGALPPGAVATVAGFGAGTFNTTGFQVTFGGSLGLVNVDSLELVDLTGATGFVGETAKGGPIDNQGWQITPTGNNPPVVGTPVSYTIPLRTPFQLTGAATDADGDTVTYLWEQNDIGVGAGTALVNPAKANGPLFRQFGTALDASVYDPKQLNSPGENHVTTDPTRTFPDLAQILINNTNAVTGDCPGAPAPPSPPSGGTNVPQPMIDCYSEFLPTASYLGTLHFRLTARDGHPAGGGLGSSDTTVSLAPGTGPFLVTSQNTGGSVDGNAPLTVTWNVAGTDVPPIGAADVKISMSADGGFTYPYVLAASTPNDGSADVSVANVATARARLKVEAVGNVFFDLNDADFSIQGVADVTNDAPFEGAVVQHSDALAPTVTVSASDPDTAGSGLTAVATGLPDGMTLAEGTTSAGATLPGTHTWKVAGRTTAAPGTYPVTVEVTDDAGHVSTNTFSIVVTQEDATPSYTGDELVFPAGGAASASVNLRAVIRDSSVVPASGDSAPGDIRKATVSFKEGATTLCGPLTVALLGAEETTGTVGCNASLPVGSHTVDVLVDGYYVGALSQVVRVLTATEAHIRGDGEIVLSNAAGSLGPASGSLAFLVDARFKDEKNQANSRPHGEVELQFRAGGKDYLSRSFDLDSVGVALIDPPGSSCTPSRSQTCIGLGDVRATAVLFEVVGKKQVKVGTGLRLHVTATDGQFENQDAIGVSLWDGNLLLFSSSWNGGDTVERLLSKGTVKASFG